MDGTAVFARTGNNFGQNKQGEIDYTTISRKIIAATKLLII